MQTPDEKSSGSPLETFTKWTHPESVNSIVLETSDTAETAGNYLLDGGDDASLLKGEPVQMTRSAFEALPEFEA